MTVYLLGFVAGVVVGFCGAVVYAALVIDADSRRILREHFRQKNGAR